MPHRRGWRLRSLLLGLAMALLLPTLALTGAAAWQAAEGHRAATEGRLRDTAKAMALAVDREIAGVIAALTAFATSPAFGPDAAAPDLPVLDAQARRLAEQLGAAIYVVGRDGMRLLTTRRPLGTPTPPVTARALVAQVFATGRPAVGDIEIGSLSGTLNFAVGVPVPGAGGEVAWMAGASFEAGRMRDLLAAQGLPGGSFAAVGDARHVLVARSDALHETLAGKPIPIENAALFAGREAGLYQALALDQVPYVFAFHVMPSAPGWTLFLGMPLVDVIAAWRRPLLGLAAGAAVALLLGGGLALFAARRILQPVSLLRDHVRAVAQPGGGTAAGAGALPPAPVAELDDLRLGFAAAEAALRAREAELAGVLEATSDGVFALDSGWRVTFISGRGAALIAGGRDITGQVLWEAFPEAVGGPFWQAYRRTMAERVSAAAESFYPPLGRHFRSESHPRPDGGIVVFFRDVTAEREAAVRLAESEARFRDTFDLAAVGIGLVGLDGRWLWVNDRLCAILGQERQALLRLTFQDVTHPEDLDADLAQAQALLAGTIRTYAMEKRYLRRDGRVAWGLLTVSLVRDATGAPRHFIRVVEDISDRKAAEAALAESEARLRLALEAGQVGTFAWNLETGELAWDERTRGFWALPHGAPVSIETFFAGLHPEDVPRLQGIIDAALDPAHGGAYEAEYRVIGRTDGVLRHIAAQGRVEFAAGRPVRMIGTVIDVTPMRQANEILAREAEQLERLAEQRARALAASEARLAEAARMEALGRLAGGIAHDVNNVLQAVQGGLKLAERRLEGDPAGARRYLALAMDATARGTAVTGRLLSFARRGELRAEPVAPAPLLEGLAEMLRHTLGPDITLTVEASPDLPALFADRAQLEAVLVNLANNARDAMPRGGILLFRAEAVAGPLPGVSAGLAEGPWLRLSVVDEGEGMPPAVLARVTEPFFTTKPKGRGTGLGLAMARSFAEQSGGALAIESEPGRGTTVSLWLPPALPGAEAAVPAADPAALPREAALLAMPATVLLAEDEAEVRAVLAAELEEHGFAVAEAWNAASAVALLDQGLRPDAIVTDLAMPGELDGLGLVQEARRRLPRLPAVLVTGHAGDAGTGRLEEVERGGAFALVRKPAAAEVLVERLGRVLGRDRAGPAADPVR